MIVTHINNWLIVTVNVIWNSEEDNTNNVLNRNIYKKNVN